MSIAIDNFTKQLHDNLEAVEARAQAIKDSIQSAPKKTQAEIQAKLDEAKKTLEAKKAEFESYRSTLKAQLDEKESEIKDNVEEWKHNREVKKLEYRADRAELYASTAIIFALAAMEQAEEATLAAIAARFDAEATEK
jgi:archaellum component FlaC